MMTLCENAYVAGEAGKSDYQRLIRPILAHSTSEVRSRTLRQIAAAPTCLASLRRISETNGHGLENARHHTSLPCAKNVRMQYRASQESLFASHPRCISTMLLYLACKPLSLENLLTGSAREVPPRHFSVNYIRTQAVLFARRLQDPLDCVTGSACLALRAQFKKACAPVRHINMAGRPCSGRSQALRFRYIRSCGGFCYYLTRLVCAGPS